MTATAAADSIAAMTPALRAALEHHQVWLYLAATAAGLAAGAASPGLAAASEPLLWPVLALLLLATFTQVPLTHIADAARDLRLLLALSTGNFLAVPLLVAALWPLVPDDPAIRLGVALVLLLPCTDWSITFTHLARGDTAGLIAAVPVLLLAQMLLLPAYLWLFLGSGELGALPAERILAVFALLIAAPLAFAFGLERWAERRPAGARLMRSLGAAPVPLLALVVLLIALGQGGTLAGAIAGLAAVTPVFVLYLAGSLGLGLAVARGFSLAPASGRAVTFSLGTRNSFVVLPIALALPVEWRLAALVIVLQSLVELLGMLLFLRLVPRLFPLAAPGSGGR